MSDLTTLTLRATLAEREEDLRIARKHVAEAGTRPSSPANDRAYDRAVTWAAECAKREQEARAAVIIHNQRDSAAGAVQLTTEQADLLYGMLTQRLYLRSDDPERATVKTTRDALYPLTTSHSEHAAAADELGIDLPPAQAVHSGNDYPSTVVGLLQRTLIGVRDGKSIGDAMDAARAGYNHSQRAANTAMQYIVRAGAGKDADTSASYIVLMARDAAISDKA